MGGHGVADADRAAVCGGLGRLLADAHILETAARLRGWAGQDGPGSLGDGDLALLSSYLRGLGDGMAGRIRQLGCPCPDSLGALLQLASVPSDPSALPGSLRVLGQDLEAVRLIARATGDEVTAHLLLLQAVPLDDLAWRLGRAGGSR